MSVPPNGYAWWYIDGMSEDGRHGLTLIAFVGSVFSPYYARRRQRGPADPLDHCAVNVALYRQDGKRWTMTERGRASVHRSATSLAIGPSAMWWEGDALTISIDEVSAPVPSRVRGVVRVHPAAITSVVRTLDSDGHHHWWPIAPIARVEATFEEPRLQWNGHGYLDSNFGDQPLEAGFARWDWSRACLSNGTTVLYDVTRRDGTGLSLAIRFDAAGNALDFLKPPATPLPPTLWRVNRQTRADRDSAVTVVRTLEDAPFYARSIIDTQVLGERTMAMHESLSLDRFRQAWVRMLLPFRMPRAWSQRTGT
jgi:carotenoid 1,2-hydratase